MVDFNLNAEETQIRDTTREFTRHEIIPKAAHWDETGEYPWEVHEKAHALGLTNVLIPEEFGGLGLGHVANVILTEELAYGCSGVSTSLTVGELPIGALVAFGTKDQLEEFTRPMTESYRHKAAYCVTEPGAGSDVQGIRTTAKRDGSDYLINGEKMWITNAGVAKWMFVLASTDPSQGYKSMVAFAVPADLNGIEVGKKEQNLGQRASDTRGVVFNRVRVPERYRIGEEGQGFKIAMSVFDQSRPGVAAGAIGVAQRALDESIKYAKERKTFGKPIAAHQAVQFMIADMATEIEAARLLCWQSASLLEQGKRNSKHAAMAKCMGGDVAVRAATNAVQIFGGYGYNKEYPVEKLYRDAKIFQIYEGTQQIQRMIIARHILETNA